MNEDNGDDLIRYDILTQDALRSVIAKVLEEVSSAGLPGEHHFFITFETNHPGVKLSPRMRERYPEEMTIVVQHSFWDLDVKDTLFEIDLSFDDIRERLRIPFASIKGFYDPSVKFGLQFDVEYEVEPSDEDEIAIAPIDDNTLTPIAGNNQDGKTSPPAASSAAADNETSDTVEQKKDAEEEKEEEAAGADVVSLDSFRKKNK